MDSSLILVLAAGLGKRMGSALPKAACRTQEKTLIEHVLESAAQLNPRKIVVVTGHKRELLEEAVRRGAVEGFYRMDSITFAQQHERLGTGDAVKAALSHIHSHNGTVLILYGDVPLIRTETLEGLLQTHREARAVLSLVSLADCNNTYGRIIRDADGKICRITELGDCTEQERLIEETNPGVYAAQADFLADAVAELTNDNVQHEYYLTDIVAAAYQRGHKIASLLSRDAAEMQGVNTTDDLTFINKTLTERQTASK